MNQCLHTICWTDYIIRMFFFCCSEGHKSFVRFNGIPIFLLAHICKWCRRASPVDTVDSRGKKNAGAIWLSVRLGSVWNNKIAKSVSSRRMCLMSCVTEAFIFLEVWFMLLLSMRKSFCPKFADVLKISNRIILTISSSLRKNYKI